jgi:superfamily I DNA/RNA helicase
VLNYTNEQNKIIESNDDFMYVIAFAGTGKTTTLKAYAEARPDKKILYVAYNDSVVKEAKKKFPTNVEVLTSHSLAYRKFGFNYKHKLNNFIKPDAIRKALLLPRSANSLILSKKVFEGIEKFCYSSYINIEDCVYLVDEIPCSKDKYLNFVKRIWRKMEDKESNFPITHDFYLKKFELLSPRLPYDAILFDEAQDANPATKSLILKQKMYSNLSILFVGDNHQEIYSFRGSQNALKSDKNEYYLTQSFRFGENIASVGNKLINIFKNEKKEIKGNRHIKDYVGSYNSNCQTAYISRTNAMVIANAIQMAEQNKRIFFVGGIKSYNFNKILDVDNLYRGNFKDIKDFNIKKYKSFKRFEEIAKQDDNSEYLFLCKIIKTYSEKLRNAMSKLNALVVHDIYNADVILSTAHKSKGLEFQQVVLSNDFSKFFDKEGNIKQDIKEEEINILYVALTRAIYSLIPNKELDKIIGFNYD